MNQLSLEERTRVVGALVEGMSLRGASRMTGIARNTIAKLLLDIGDACDDFTDRAVRNVRSTRVELDEMWGFIGGKQKTKKLGANVYGDIWLWTCVCPDSKLVVSWLLGPRNHSSALWFVKDLSERIPGRVQITTDALAAYSWPIYSFFKDRADYAQVHKVFRASEVSPGRYSPPECVAQTKQSVRGQPDLELASTSHVERNNLGVRMGMKRYARLTNAHSKKLVYHAASTSLHFTYYNFARPNMGLGGKTPAQAAGLSDRRWTIADLVGLLDGVKSRKGAIRAN
ncbi:MAG: IS1 family transposase [Planctomycetes bacterium]|nr:IS1 family transposase [Planctomycetota bacterium]